MASAQPLTLAGKVAIVTGASRGIGAAVALELANRGAKVSAAPYCRIAHADVPHSGRPYIHLPQQ